MRDDLKWLRTTPFDEPSDCPVRLTLFLSGQTVQQRSSPTSVSKREERTVGMSTSRATSSLSVCMI